MSINFGNALKCRAKRLVMPSLKQALVLDEAKGLSKGKMISQACHASLEAFEEADSNQAKEWRVSGAKKVALESGERDLEEIYDEAVRAGLPTSLIRDAGLTELEPGTLTAVGIGPAEEPKIDRITGELKLIR